MSSSGKSGGGGLALIQRQLLAAPAATVTFANIPQNYENLVLRYTAQQAGAGITDLRLRFNGDAGNNYDNAQCGLNGPAAGTGNPGMTTYGESGASGIPIGSLPHTGMGAGLPGSGFAVIPGYARTVFNKQVTAQWSRFSAAAQNLSYTAAGEWHNTAAVVSLLLFTANGANLIAGCVFSLYGEI